ncbi:G1/S-specific cyclin-E1 [Mycoemilia scoparia]|uniref:G1/S-specific cyclin-E1 n=1 Tax=Mycoemilia scoparia TaxID=417184 RepID=A0A9W8A148_9FUNG|nr:G1/S-specific cyclin-E1 [Mycoemilia scoparia]
MNKENVLNKSQITGIAVDNIHRDGDTLCSQTKSHHAGSLKRQTSRKRVISQVNGFEDNHATANNPKKRAQQFTKADFTKNDNSKVSNVSSKHSQIGFVWPDMSDMTCCGEDRGEGWFNTSILESQATLFSSPSHEYTPASQAYYTEAGGLPAQEEKQDISEYASLLYKLERDLSRFCPNVADSRDFVRHPLLSSQMRPILIDWMMEVCSDYRFHRKTLQLAISYFDQVMSIEGEIPPTELQCYGSACLSLAIKTEESYHPKLRDLTEISQGAFTLSELRDCEQHVLRIIGYNLSTPTILDFLCLFFQQISTEIRCLKRLSDECLSEKQENLHSLTSGINVIPSLAKLDSEATLFSSPPLRPHASGVYTPENMHVFASPVSKGIEILSIYDKDPSEPNPQMQSSKAQQDSTYDNSSHYTNQPFLHKESKYLHRIFSDHPFTIACDYIDLALHGHQFLRFKYSMVAAAAMFISFNDCNVPFTSDQFFGSTGYTVSEIQQCVDHIEQLITATNLRSRIGNIPVPITQTPKIYYSCCEKESRFGIKWLQRIPADEIWAFQPHHRHMLGELENVPL